MGLAGEETGATDTGRNGGHEEEEEGGGGPPGRLAGRPSARASSPAASQLTGCELSPSFQPGPAPGYPENSGVPAAIGRRPPPAPPLCRSVTEAGAISSQEGLLGESQLFTQRRRLRLGAGRSPPARSLARLPACLAGAPGRFFFPPRDRHSAASSPASARPPAPARRASEKLRAAPIAPRNRDLQTEAGGRLSFPLARPPEQQPFQGALGQRASGKWERSRASGGVWQLPPVRRRRRAGKASRPPRGGPSLAPRLGWAAEKSRCLPAGRPRGALDPGVRRPASAPALLLFLLLPPAPRLPPPWPAS